MAWYHQTKLERQMIIDAGQCVRCCRRRDWVEYAGKQLPTDTMCAPCAKAINEAARNNYEFKKLLQAKGDCLRCWKPRGSAGNDKFCRRCLTIRQNEKKARNKKKHTRGVTNK